MLAAMKLGAVLIPASTLLTAGRPARSHRRAARSRHVIVAMPTAREVRERAGDCMRVAVGARARRLARLRRRRRRAGRRSRRTARPGADDPLLLYFTCGTTRSRSSCCTRTQSYPVGHLSTMYWLGLQPGDVHLNISSPGWAKHAWCASSRRGTPGPRVFSYNQPRFHAPALLEALVALPGHDAVRAADGLAHADPGDLAACRSPLRELVGAGEPLNPEVIEQVARPGASRSATATARPRRPR